jgi:hypothetical protein
MLRPGRFTTVKEPVPTVQEAGRAPGPHWTGTENSSSRYTDWANLAHLYINIQQLI